MTFAGSEIVNVLGYPPAIIQFLEVGASLMIATNEDCEIGRCSLAAVVLVEVANSSVFNGNRHRVKVMCIADCLKSSERPFAGKWKLTDLKITTNDKEINSIP